MMRGRTLAAFELSGGPELAAEARHRVSEVLRAAQYPMRIVEDATLAVSELAANAFLHGGAHEASVVEFELLEVEERLRVTVIDEGDVFMPRGDPPEEYTGGMGLWLVEQLSDRWGLVRQGRTEVWFEISLLG